jgi:hypothetical protein
MARSPELDAPAFPHRLQPSGPLAPVKVERWSQQSFASLKKVFTRWPMTMMPEARTCWRGLGEGLVRALAGGTFDVDTPESRQLTGGDQGSQIYFHHATGHGQRLPIGRHRLRPQGVPIGDHGDDASGAQWPMRRWA